MPANDNTSKCSSFFSPGTICAASIIRQSSRYNSFKRDPNESAKILILADERREHWLRLMDLSAGAEETSTCNPLSDRRHAPLRDRVINFGNHLGDCLKVPSNA